MRKLLLLAVILLLLGGGSFLLFNKKPPVKPSIAPTPQIATQNSPSTSPSDPNLSFLKLSSSYVIHTYADNLGNPRDLAISPGGTVLVSVPNSNSVIALSDEDGDGTPQENTALKGSNTVHGLAFHGNDLYVAEKNSVLLYTWNEQTKVATLAKKILDLPGNTNHIYRTLIVSSDNRLYVSIGSNCNVCVEPNPMVGTVISSTLTGSDVKIFAKGQRNAPFLAINPTTHDIWATGMGRDYLGDNLPPDEVNILKEGDFGWPICYGNRIHDTSFDKKQYIQDPCKNTIAPIYEIPAHSAPLGLAFVPESFSSSWKGDLLVAYHGSWNRTTKTGYKVVHLTVSGDTIVKAEDFITGFLDGDTVRARPVDLAFDHQGNLYISDDLSGKIFLVKKVR